MAHKVQRILPFAVAIGLCIFLMPLLTGSAWAQGKGNGGNTNKGSGGGGGKPPKNTGCVAFEDTFDGNKVDGNLWVVANGQAPGYIPATHIGYYVPGNVTVSGGYLRIKLTQDYGTVDGVGGIVSQGGMVYSKQKCGYGTYEWTVRMSTTSPDPAIASGGPISGSVSAGFNYVNNSETEIDFEFSALTDQRLYMVNWLNTNPKRDPTGQQETYSYLDAFNSTSSFHHYKYVWEPGKIAYYVDGVESAVHLTNVPTAPAYFMINHWGTDSDKWGGWASVGVTRYYYIDSVKFTPLP